MDKESEIERLILDTVPAYEEYDSLCELGAAMKQAAKKTAHAIAERMKAGVEAEFEGRWQVDDLGYHVLTVSSLTKCQDKRIRISQIAQGGPPDEGDGQRVRVTVKLEGEDGQEATT